MRRALLVLLFTLLLAPAALAQQTDPFSPLPQAPTPVPTPPEATPVPTPVGSAFEEGPDRTLLFTVAGAALVLLAGIGFFITRDARRKLTPADRRSLERERAGAPREQLTPQQRKQADRAKQKAREKAKRQRQARKAQRRR